MREIIRKQLENLNFVELNQFDPQTGCFIIPKYSKPVYDIGKCYLVKVSADLVNNRNSVIAANWNNSTCPSTEYLKIYVSKQKGKMIFVDSLAFDIQNNRDLSTMWSGWLPTDSLTQMATLE